jgi:hypothetical protein
MNTSGLMNQPASSAPQNGASNLIGNVGSQKSSVEMYA